MLCGIKNSKKHRLAISSGGAVFMDGSFLELGHGDLLGGDG